jgi:hypothetical protein
MSQSPGFWKKLAVVPTVKSSMLAVQEEGPGKIA